MFTSSHYSPSILLKANPEDDETLINKPLPLNFHGKDLHNVTFNGGCFKRCNLSGANLSHATLTNVDLSLANLRGANLSNTKFINCHFFPDQRTNYLPVFTNHLNWYEKMYIDDVNLPILKPLILKDLVARVENSDWEIVNRVNAIQFLTKLLDKPFGQPPESHNIFARIFRFFAPPNSSLPNQRIIGDAIKRLEYTRMLELSYNR